VAAHAGLSTRCSAPDKSARMVNSAGEEFFNQRQDDPLAYGPTRPAHALARRCTPARRATTAAISPASII
jgi:hypothetical protein